ncbi:hypothetical protein [Aquibacillus sediminis]|uniref:hypothetical protein n=1 Tax=Aquibacillus sediminis TaxID=2574734 RepID=UPI00110826B7|nr:hypothetical protein [Aquibacillus sediminis]
MKKIVLMLIILISVIIAGCSNQYNNEEVIAVVDDKEITVADVRLFYNPEEKGLNEAVKDYVKEEIMVQEAKKMGINISEEVEELKAINSPFPQEQTEKQSEYAKAKAEKLGVTEEEYYKKYLDVSTERSAYITKYLEKEVGQLNEEDTADEYTEKVNDYVDSLLVKHSDDIEILIN